MYYHVLFSFQEAIYNCRATGYANKINLVLYDCKIAQCYK